MTKREEISRRLLRLDATLSPSKLDALVDACLASASMGRLGYWTPENRAAYDSAISAAEVAS